jgi:hypothetical protein
MKSLVSPDGILKLFVTSPPLRMHTPVPFTSIPPPRIQGPYRKFPRTAPPFSGTSVPPFAVISAAVLAKSTGFVLAAFVDEQSAILQT